MTGNDQIKYIVMYSGGLCSYSAARRLIDRVGPEFVTLLFADTSMEDDDLYRFLDESASSLSVPLVKLRDGRNPWEVFISEKFIGNSRIDPCSRILKRKSMDKWINSKCDKNSTYLVFGLDWQERGRIDRHRARSLENGWKCLYPMNDRPYLTRDDMLSELIKSGIRPPRLYELGFPHNNCGGFCVKMGMAQARHLLRTLPDRYSWHEEQERLAMEAIGPTARPFLRKRVGGKTVGITMREYREQLEAFPLLDQQIENSGWGCGGGCAIDDPESSQAEP